jgi:hypothetical protein
LKNNYSFRHFTSTVVLGPIVLQEKVGPDVAVEAMMSNTGHVFYGDLRSHERAGFCSGLANYKSSHMDGLQLRH